jgi:hypothetical protein
VWWKEENRYIYGLSPSAKIGVSLKGVLYLLMAFSLVMHAQKETVERSSVYTIVLVLLILLAGCGWFCMRRLSSSELGPKKRMGSAIFGFLLVVAIVVIFNTVDSVVLGEWAIYRLNRLVRLGEWVPRAVLDPDQYLY